MVWLACTFQIQLRLAMFTLIGEKSTILRIRFRQAVREDAHRFVPVNAQMK
jgi:hypothetical protein